MSLQTAILEQQAKEKLEEGQYQEAYDLLQQAIAHDDTDDTHLLEQAINIAHEHLSLFEDVVNYANIILMQDENKLRTRLQRAWANYDLGNTEASLNDFQHVIETAEDANDVMYARSGRGLCYYSLYQYEEAATDLTDSLVIYDEWAVGFAHLGWTYYFLKQFDQAKKTLERAIELSPTPYYFAHGGLGLTCYELQEYDLAIDELTIGLEDYTTWALGYATRGWSYLDIKYYQNQQEYALADFNKAIELSEGAYPYAQGGRGIVYYEMQEYEKAVVDLEQALVDNTQWHRGYAVLGWSLLELERYNEALEKFDYVIHNSDNQVYPYANAGRGVVNFELYKLPEAKADLEIGLQENPKWLRGIAILAWVNYELATNAEAYQKALEQFNSVLEQAPDYSFAHGGRGLVYYELNNYQEAVADLDQSLGEESSWSKGYSVRAWAKYYLAQTKEDFEAVLADFNHALTLYAAAGAPDNPFTIAGRGYTHFQLSQYRQAVEDLTIAVDFYQDWLAGYTFLARAYNALNEGRKVIATYKKAIECVTDKAAAHHELALFLEDCGQYKQAINHYEQAIEINPKSWMYGSLAELYQRGLGVAQDEEKAFQLFQQAYALQEEAGDVDYFDAPLINCYHQQLGTTDSPKTVQQIIQNAMTKKNANAQFMLLMIYFKMHGYYMPQDEKMAKEILARAIKLYPNNPWVMYYQYVLGATAQEKPILKAKILKNLPTAYENEGASELKKALKHNNPELLYPMNKGKMTKRFGIFKKR